jgi:hypothetical protein
LVAISHKSPHTIIIIFCAGEQRHLAAKQDGQDASEAAHYWSNKLPY